MSGTTFTTADFQGHNIENLSHSFAVRTHQNTTAQRPVFGYSLMLHYGQSKSVGEQGYPAQTTTPAYPSEVFMLGGSPRPVALVRSAPNVTLYTTFTDNTFHPLICTNQDGTNPTLITPRTGTITANNVTVTIDVEPDGSTMAKFTWPTPPDPTTIFEVADIFQCQGFTVATGNNANASSAEGNVFTIISVSTSMGTATLKATGVSSAQETTSPESGILFAQAGFTYMGQNAFGEEAGVCHLNEFRSLELDYYGLDQDTTRKWVMANGGVSGQDIAALSRGASPNLYNRIIEAATKFKAASVVAGATFGMPGVLFNHGGADEMEGTTSAAYKAGYKTLIDNINTDITAGILSQSKPPFWLGVVVDGGAINTGIIAQARMELFGCSPATGFSTPYSPNMYMIGGILSDARPWKPSVAEQLSLARRHVRQCHEQNNVARPGLAAAARHRRLAPRQPGPPRLPRPRASATGKASVHDRRTYDVL
jgi:hypothetical protein